MSESKMVKVSIEVGYGTARFKVAVRAHGIQRALSLVGERYPGTNCQVVFPVDPESFFVDDPAARAGITGFEQQPHRAAA